MASFFNSLKSAIAPRAATGDAVDAEVVTPNEDLHERFDKYMERCKHQRHVFEREWLLYVNYYSGNHWMIWDTQRKQYRKKNLPPEIPQPVTNRFAEKIDDNIASLTQELPVLSWVPETDDPVDIATAEVADRIDETIDDECGRARQARDLASWVALTGNGFVESYYDNSPEHGQSFIQFEECQQCGHVSTPMELNENEDRCPQCGSDDMLPAYQVNGSLCSQCGLEVDDPAAAFQPCPNCTQQIEQAAMAQMMGVAPQPAPVDPMAQGAPVDPMGADPIAGQPPADPMIPAPPAPGMQPAPASGMPPALPEPPLMKPRHTTEEVGMEVPRGKMCQRVRSPFEVYFDHTSVKNFNESESRRYAILVDLIDFDEARRLYKLPKDFADTNASKNEESLSTMYLESLSVLSNLSDGRTGSFGLATSGGNTSKKVLREILYELPCDDYPEGLLAIRVNGKSGQVVSEGPLAFHDTNGNPFIPLTHFGFKVQAGRAWAKTVAADLVQLQDIRNQTECQMMLIERRMASPVWKLPKGVVERAPSGLPGEVVWYNLFSSGEGGRQPLPEREQGVAPSMYFIGRLENIDTQMEMLSGSFGVSHGEPPPGVTAASALALLGERQSRQVSPQVRAWEMSWERVAWQQMMIFREYAVDERVLMRMDANSTWRVEKWSNADLTGRINVKVEIGSATPKSFAQRRAQIEGLVTMGVVDVANPEVNRQVLSAFGEAQLVAHIDVDIKDAQQENERFMRLAYGKAGGQLPRLRPLFDNHMAHVVEHIKQAKADKYRELEERAEKGEPWALQAVAFWENHVKEHMAAMAAAQAEAEGAAEGEEEEGPGAGRPKGSGKKLDRGKRSPKEEQTRSIAEPRTP